MATDCTARSNNYLEAAGALRGGGSRRPPIAPRAASGFSGRRFCRIFREGEAWVLRADTGTWGLETGISKCFPTLSAAIAYAVANDYSYRVFHASEKAHGGKTERQVPGSRKGLRDLPPRS
jgi:hypothetical protein